MFTVQFVLYDETGRRMCSVIGEGPEFDARAGTRLRLDENGTPGHYEVMMPATTAVVEGEDRIIVSLRRLPSVN